jgi:hypothetical protein
MIEDFHKRDQPIFFYHVKPKIVSIFLGVNPKGFKYCNNEDDLNDMLKGVIRKLLSPLILYYVFSSFSECASKIYTSMQCNTHEEQLSTVD